MGSRELPHSLLRAARSPTGALEPLKHSARAGHPDHLGLPSLHLALTLRSPHSSPRAPASAPGDPQALGPKARETEAWEEPVGLPGLPVARRDQQEGALPLLLARQLRAWPGGTGPRGQPMPGEAPPSPPTGPDSEGPEGPAARTGLSSPGGEEDTDKPLDLSERARGRGPPTPAVQPGMRSPPAAHAPSPRPLLGAEPPALPRSPWALSGGIQGARTPEPEEPPAVKGRRPSLPSPGRTPGEARGRPRPYLGPQGPQADSPPEPRAAHGLRLDLDTSDNEVGLSPPSSLPGAGPRCACGQERGPGQQRKRNLREAVSREEEPRGAPNRGLGAQEPEGACGGQPLTGHQQLRGGLAGSGTPRASQPHSELLGRAGGAGDAKEASDHL
ncbi:PREDICTED: RBBP8 N-terminal-like protein [Condylura cristata]|uniref:RBBP8 N-terminal-like protein n=1 Tax=Condylura cristata TaxID=143302 RepID=UPI000642E575|nr:PREDICTED: RBBP8 N-terminal-like protein [Condylura cristata]